MAVADTTIRKTVALPRETGERLARMAEREGVTEAAILRSIIEAGLMGYETADDVFERLNAAAAQGSDALTLELFRLREHPLFLGTFGSGVATFVRLKGDILLEHLRGASKWTARHITQADLNVVRQFEDAVAMFRSLPDGNEPRPTAAAELRASRVRAYRRKSRIPVLSPLDYHYTPNQTVSRSGHSNTSDVRDYLLTMFEHDKFKSALLFAWRRHDGGNLVGIAFAIAVDYYIELTDGCPLTTERLPREREIREIIEAARADGLKLKYLPEPLPRDPSAMSPEDAAKMIMADPDAALPVHGYQQIKDLADLILASS